MVDDGLRFTAINLWVRGRQAGRVAFGDIGAGLSPFPYMIIYAQDEQLLENMQVALERDTPAALQPAEVLTNEMTRTRAVSYKSRR